MSKAPQPPDRSDATRAHAARRAAAYRQRADDLIAVAGDLPLGAQRDGYLRAASRWLALADLQDTIAGSADRAGAGPGAMAWLR